MEATFTLLKNGNNAVTVWANAETKEICIANRNPFGYNMTRGLDSDFDRKYGCFMKTTQGRGDYRKFYYSAKSMQEAGFTLVLRGSKPLF